MNYYELTNLFIEAQFLCLYIYFTITFLFGGKQYRYHSAVYMVFALLYMFFAPVNPHEWGTVEYHEAFIVFTEQSVMIDACLTIALAIIIFDDELAFKHCMIMTFAVAVHMVLLYSLTNDGNLFVNSILGIYDEVIIVLNFLILWVSKDGFKQSIGNIGDIASHVRRAKTVHSRFVFHSRGAHKNVPKSKDSEVKT